MEVMCAISFPIMTNKFQFYEYATALVSESIPQKCDSTDKLMSFCLIYVLGACLFTDTRLKCIRNIFTESVLIFQTGKKCWHSFHGDCAMSQSHDGLLRLYSRQSTASPNK